MANPIIQFEGQEANFINENQLKLTLKLLPTEPGPSSYGDVFTVLDREGLKPSDILGLYKVSANDYSYSLFLSNEGILQKLKNKKVIGTGNTRFNVVSMSEQVVTLRVHWLPLFYDNRILKAIFCDYGEVLDIRMCKSSYANLVALNGLREVILKTDEVLKQKIPHLVKFNCGQSLLVTMQGRPPLCLKCHVVGHTRRDCEANKTFARVTASSALSAGVARVGTSMVSVARPSDPVAAEPLAEATPEPMGSGDVPLSHEVGAGGSGASVAVSDDQQPVIDNDMGESAASKRGRDDDEDDFITPNKPARMGPPSSESPVPLTRGFTPIMSVTDILSESDNEH